MGRAGLLTGGIRTRILLAGVASTVVCLLCAAHAEAAITGSSITSPATGTQLYYNGDSGTGNVTVSGTVIGATSGSQGDLLCLWAADTASTTIATGIDVSSGGFAVNVSLASIAGFVCRLALVPSATTPTGAAAAAFAGPAIGVARSASHSSGGVLYGYDVLAGPLSWSFELESLGECPVFGSWATEPSIEGSFQLFAGNACLPQTSGIAPDLDTRSAVQIDGVNAYPPGAIGATANQGGGLTGDAGFVPLTYSTSFDAAHDAVTIAESDTLVSCDPPGGFPPTPSTCPSLHESGVQAQQSTTLLPGGQVARVSQRFASTDGKAHTIDALFGQSVQGPSGTIPGFAFPGQSSLVSHSAPDSFSTFSSGPGSIYVIANSAAPPATSNPVGAIAYNRPPASANFISASASNPATFVMHYTDTVPADGSVSYDWSFTQAATLAALTPLARGELDRFFTPAVVIRRPANRSLSRNSSITVQGTATDPIGLSAVKVDGAAVGVAATGSFTARVPLRLGSNAINVTATNQAGNLASASVTVSYVPYQCTVPRLRGKQLAAAKNALRRSHCAVGKVKQVRSTRVKRGTVIATSPKAGARRRLGTKVALTVSRGAGIRRTRR
ncbi:MAG: PASTA domain-containing protein [Solirubrobacterales bacterium]|nr:PASTA domain-containing protein [Solirubrobacterales bacterium]